MAITVTHKFVSTIPDGDDTTVVRPSNWNDTHELTGLGTMAEQNANNVSITGGSISSTTVSGYIPTTQKGAVNGVASLDSNGQVPLSQLPPLGELNYQGTWNASTNTPTLTSSVGTKGYYYVVSVAGTTNLNGITDWQVGDWAVYSGTAWQKVDNTDAVTSVNGQTGTVVLTAADVGAVSSVAATAGTGISVTGSPITSTGTLTITNTAPDQTVVLTAGTGISTSGTYPNFTITNTSPSAGGDVVGPASATDNAIARFDSTTGKLIQNSVVTVSDTGDIAGAATITDINYVDFNTSYITTLGAGQLGWDGNNTLGLGMAGGNIVQRIGEDTFIYVKASSTITKGQLTMFTGAVGASGVVTAAPSTGITSGQTIIGLAAENISNNAFGLIQVTGNLKGFNTSAFADGDILYYDSAVTGGMTNVYPTSGPIVTVAAVTNAGSGGSGSVQIRVSVTQRVTASTGISVSQTGAGTTITNTAPDQVVALTAGTGISVSGTYPNFTVTNTEPSSGGTVTSVTGTAPIASSGGNTPAISISQSGTSTDGYLSSTDWNTFNNKATYPSQTGNSGKFLTTNGSATSWATLPTVLPVLNHFGSSVSVAVGNGLLPVLSHSGGTINVAVQ